MAALTPRQESFVALASDNQEFFRRKAIADDVRA